MAETVIHEGEVLQEALKYSPIGIKGLAEKLGWNRPRLYRVFKKTRIETEIKEDIAKAIGVTVEQLFTRSPVQQASVTLVTRITDTSRDWYTNKHGNQFEPLTDGTYRVYHKHVLGPVHAAYAAGWGDPEFTDSLPGRTSIVNEISEDLFLSFTVTGECQDDGTIDGIVPGMEITGQGMPRSMWQYKLPYMETNPLKKLPKIKLGDKEIEVPAKNKSYRYWIIVDRFKGMRVAMIKEQDVEKGILHCFCRNPDKKQYPDFQVNLDDCSQIFYVIKRVFND